MLKSNPYLSNDFSVKNVILISDQTEMNGGTSKVLIDTANLLANIGKNVLIFTGSPKINRVDLRSSIQIHSTNQLDILSDKKRFRALFRGIYNFKSKNILLKILNEFDPSNTIIHIHSINKILSASVVPIVQKKKFPLVITCHDYSFVCPNGIFYDYKKQKICELNGESFSCLCTNCDSRSYQHKVWRWLRKYFADRFLGLKDIKHLICLSQWQADVVGQYYPSSKLHIVPNPIEHSIPERQVQQNVVLYV